jgi:hypothetical protein
MRGILHTIKLSGSSSNDHCGIAAFPWAKTDNAAAQMHGNPGYDDTTIRALRDYFAIFAPAGKP